MAEFSPSMNFISNAAAPAYLAYITKKAGVKKFIYAGSCSVYGYTVNELFNEDSPTISDYPYGISKLQGERAVMQLPAKAFRNYLRWKQYAVIPRMRLILLLILCSTSIIDNRLL
jgi:nucleoside-diphosphate-sugar epimerase